MMKRFLDMIYPRSCLGCGLSAPETFRYICWDCWTNTTRVEAPFCSQCGDPVAGTIDHDFVCYSCSAVTPSFDGARSAARYDGVVGEALRQLKYEQALWLVPDLAHLLHNCLGAEYPGLHFDTIVPVPLYRVRRRERGYNQSGLLATALGRIMACPVGSGLIRRIRPTATQTNLTAKERISNVGNAFKHGKTRRLVNRRILLVDDVMTTGATVNACAKALKKGGAASVHVVTAARG
jgi:ComF family protein